MYFPDEYMYSELGRSISTGGRPLVRGTESTFPALLQPILTAPAWLLGDVATAYHAIQVANALAMSLAAVPVYLLARRVGVGDRLALVAAAIALVLPDLLYAGWMLSEPFAYPLALLARTAGGARTRPARRSAAQLAFLAWPGWPRSPARSSLLLLVCFVVAAVVLGLRERALVRPCATSGSSSGLVAARGRPLPRRGAQRRLLRRAALDRPRAGEPRAPARDASRSHCSTARAGCSCPAAVLGLAAAIGRPRTRAELALGAFTIPFAVGLVLQASLWGDTGQMQERYLFYCVPLLAVGVRPARGAWVAVVARLRTALRGDVRARSDGAAVGLRDR